jgi:uncharacterized protein (DUF2147 family)
MLLMKKLLTGFLMCFAFSSIGSWANENSPIGLWKNIDDKTGKSKALIRITEQGGIFEGRIEKLFLNPDEDQNPKCVKCEGALKDQPNLGMKILSGISQQGIEYSGGTIIDPENGKSYKSKLLLDEGGKKLVVRGFIGISLLGRSQIWERVE